MTGVAGTHHRVRSNDRCSGERSSVGARLCHMRETDYQYGRNSKSRIWAHSPRSASPKGRAAKISFKGLRAKHRWVWSALIGHEARWRMLGPPCAHWRRGRLRQDVVHHALPGHQRHEAMTSPGPWADACWRSLKAMRRAPHSSRPCSISCAIRPAPPFSSSRILIGPMRRETGDTGLTRSLYFFVFRGSDMGMASLSCLCPLSGTRTRRGLATAGMM